MNITESNKKIAKFMGYRYIPHNNEEGLKAGWWKDAPDMKDAQSREAVARKISKGRFLCRNHHQLRYYNSWDWLMPVVEKVEKNHHTGGEFIVVEIALNSCLIRTASGYQHNGPALIMKHGDSKLKATYEAIIEFIDEHQGS